MKRLTDKRLALPPGVWQEVTHEETRELKEIPVPSMRELYYRLSLYEDTGLEPEEILSAVDMAKVACALEELNAYKELGSLDRLRELAKADREGRCVVLPAPLGNTVYRIEYVEQCQGRYEIGICKHRFDILFYAMECRNFGKTVFLTREEAEAALATDC